MYTFMTAYDHAECQQTAYIKKEGRKHSHKNKSWVVSFLRTHAWFEPQIPHL